MIFLFVASMVGQHTIVEILMVMKCDGIGDKNQMLQRQTEHPGTRASAQSLHAGPRRALWSQLTKR